MLWHALAAHLQSLPCRACSAETKHSGGRGTHTHIKLSLVCCGFWSQNALRKENKVQHVNRQRLHILLHASEAQLWIRINCYVPPSHSFKSKASATSVFWQLEILLWIRLIHGCVTLFDCFKTNWRHLLEDLLPQNPSFQLWHYFAYCGDGFCKNVFSFFVSFLFYSVCLVISQKN